MVGIAALQSHRELVHALETTISTLEMGHRGRKGGLTDRSTVWPP